MKAGWITDSRVVKMRRFAEASRMKDREAMNLLLKTGIEWRYLSV
jgi:hypothetical protein